jgi:hypothetical protein
MTFAKIRLEEKAPPRNTVPSRLWKKSPGEGTGPTESLVFGAIL